MLPLAGNEEFRGRGRVRVRSKNENDSGGPRGEKTSSSSGFVSRRPQSFSIVLVLVLVLVSAIGCKGEDVGVPKSNKLALMGLKPRAEPSRPLRGEEAFQISLNLAPFSQGLTSPIVLVLVVVLVLDFDRYWLGERKAGE